MNKQEKLSEVFIRFWEERYRENVQQENADCIRFYRASVTANPGDGTLTVQRAFDNPINLPCVGYMQGAQLNSQVVVALFGKGARANSVVIGDGKMQIPQLSKLPQRYTKVFQITDFTISSGSYVLTVLASTHCLGTGVDASLWQKNGTSYEKVFGYPSPGWKLAVDASGNVTLTVPTAFDGKLVLYST